MLSTYVGSQQTLVVRLPNMHERHPWASKGLCITLSKLVGLLLGNHARAGATPSKWPTETAYDIAVDHRNGSPII